jgi:F0F1-type ATP synthase assembly protein I
MSQDKQTQALDAAALASTVSQIGCVTGLMSIVIIGAAFGAGRLLDTWTGLNGVFTVIALVASFPLTLFFIVRYSLTSVARTQERLSKDKQEQNKET